MTPVLFLLCAGTLALLSVLVVYQCVLAVAALLPRAARPTTDVHRLRFVVMVPAYNEEVGIAATIASLHAVNYPSSLVSVVVAADRCQDGTASRARAAGAECLERSDGTPGKGPAIAWAIEQLRRRGDSYDALVLLDADTLVDPMVLESFERGLQHGHGVQQGYNYLSNPWDTPFTRIISVTSVLRNALFYGGKERLGLPAMLSGCGMCFSRGVIERYGWTAFSVGEDWEFSASLLLSGETIHFNRDSRVMARESRGFQQASKQRLRWASGRHAVARTSARALLKAGVRGRRIDLCDAALTISAPTYSVQAALALVCLVGSFLAPDDVAWRYLAVWSAAVTGLLTAYFVAGLAMTDKPLRAFAGVVLIPVFLPWRIAIELLGLLGFGRKHWVRTARSA